MAGLQKGKVLNTSLPAILPSCNSAMLTAAEGRKYKPRIVPNINELFKLDGRIAIVTGGARGLAHEKAEGPPEARCSRPVWARPRPGRPAPPHQLPHPSA